MSKKDFELLKERLVGRYDPDYLVDLLGIESEELLEAFPEKLAQAVMAGEFDEVIDED